MNTQPRPLTIPQEMAIRYLFERGFSGPQIIEALGDVSRWQIRVATAGYRQDGTVTLYRDDCIVRARADPCHHEAAEYLYVRGVSLEAIGDVLGVSHSQLMTYPDAKRRYQARQVEIVRAAVAEGREL